MNVFPQIEQGWLAFSRFAIAVLNVWARSHSSGWYARICLIEVSDKVHVDKRGGNVLLQIVLLRKALLPKAVLYIAMPWAIVNVHMTLPRLFVLESF